MNLTKIKNDVEHFKSTIKTPKGKNDLLIIKAVWIIILLMIFSTACTKQEPAPPNHPAFILNAEANTEDYGEDIKMRFGDKLRESQLETRRVYERAKAIACQEGYYKKGTIAQRNNNPGNLKKSGYPVKNGHSYFETPMQGWMELHKLLYKYNHLTLEQMNSWYATDPNWARGVKRCYNKMFSE